MSRRALLLSSALLFAVACGPADASDGGAESAAATAATPAPAENPRFGVWKIRSDAPPPALNIMTYEPYGDGGMKITVEATNAQGEKSVWGYVTMFDGVFNPVEGREGTETAVAVVDARTNRITSRRDGTVSQVIINVLSEDGNMIENEYRSTDGEGNERISHAIYDRIR